MKPHKLYKVFRSQGYELSKDTLYRYLHYLEESYIVFLLPVAERSVRKRAMNPKKLHAVDWALEYPLVPEPFIDVGHKLETAVYLHCPLRLQPSLSQMISGLSPPFVSSR